MTDTLPNIDPALLRIPVSANFKSGTECLGKPRVLLLYGSNRERSYSRLMVEEAARLLRLFGAETRIFNPSGLPLADDAPDTHPKVQELREAVLWSEGQVWSCVTSAPAPKAAADRITAPRLCGSVT